MSDKAEKAGLFRGDEREMKFATVKVASALLGQPGATVKVGFFVPSPSRPGRPPARQSSTTNLTSGQEACLFLTNHPTRKGVFYLTSADDVPGSTYSPEWKKWELPPVQQYATLIAAPMKALRSKDADKRLLAATLLVERFNTPNASGHTEPVPARETRLNPRALFVKLGATAKDGWVQPKEYSEVAPAAKKWLKDNAGTFKMTRFVRDKAAAALSEEP